MSKENIVEVTPKTKIGWGFSTKGFPGTPDFVGTPRQVEEYRENNKLWQTLRKTAIEGYFVDGVPVKSTEQFKRDLTWVIEPDENGNYIFEKINVELAQMH